MTSFLCKESKAHTDRTFFNSLGARKYGAITSISKNLTKVTFRLLEEMANVGVLLLLFCERPMFIVSAGAKLSLHTTRQKLL